MGIASAVRRYVETHISGEGIELCEDGDKIRAGSRRIRDPYAMRGVDDGLDYIACTHFLEHFDKPEEILELWFSKLRLGGRLALTLPHKKLYPGPGDPGNPAHKFTCDEEDIIAMMDSIGASYRLVARGVDDGGSLSFFIVFEKIRGDSKKHLKRASDGRKIRYAVVIPYKDHADMTEACVQSLKDAGWEPEQVVLVDDGSEVPVDDDSVALEGLNVTHVHNKKNKGFPVSVNRGVSKADKSCRVIVLLNNDTVVLPGGDKKLLSRLVDTSVAITGQQGGKLGREYAYAGEGDDYVEFYCAAVKRSVWDELDGLDESFSPGYSEDSDFCLRLREKGYGVEIIGPGVCKHLRSQTFSRSDDTNKLIERNRKYLAKKHNKGDVLFCVASYHPSGGIKVVWNCAKALRDAGYRVSAMLCAASNAWPEVTAQWAEFDGLYTVPGLKQSGYKFDYVVGTFYPTWPYAMDVPASKHHVGLVQSDEPRWTAEPGQPFNEEAAKKFSIKGFKSVIVADYMYEFREKYGMDIVGKIDNGVDSRVFYPDNTFGRKWDHSLLTIRKGVHVWFDGQEIADEAAGILGSWYDDFRYIILGSQTGFVKWKKPCKNCELLQTHDEERVRSLYNHAGAYVIPSRIEGSSLTALEAMACGTPLVCTEIASDAAVDGETALIVPYDDPIAIARAVARTFDDDLLREKLYHNGMKTAFGRSHEKQREQFVSIIESL